MKDTTIYQIKDGRLLLISYQGSTVFFNISDLPFNPNNVQIQSSVRDTGNILIGNFDIIKNLDNIDFELPFTITETMDPIPEFLSDINIIKNINNIDTGKYYFDIEITENNKKYKTLSGILVLLPEYTK